MNEGMNVGTIVWPILLVSEKPELNTEYGTAKYRIHYQAAWESDVSRNRSTNVDKSAETVIS